MEYDGDGFESAVLSVKDALADVSRNGKADNDGFNKVVFHLESESHGHRLVIQSGEYESTRWVEFDPANPRTDRIITASFGHSCRVVP